MSTTMNYLFREAIRKTLIYQPGKSLNAGKVTESTISTWNKMSARLEPVIGTKGFEVLFRRSLHLAAPSFPCLSNGGYQGNSTALLSNLKESLSGSESDVAAEASYTLLVTFIELLTSLVGESLVESLLGPVWVDPLSMSEQENDR